MSAVVGAGLLSAVDGRGLGGRRDSMLGASTMRATGARLGTAVRVTVTGPTGVPHQTTFRVIGRASLNAGTGGLGNGAGMTIPDFVSPPCPPRPGQSPPPRPAGAGTRPRGPAPPPPRP